MIDSKGYRLNVGIILMNSRQQVFWGKRIKQNAWQFPQGGLAEKETPEAGMLRELTEEVGVTPQNVKIIAQTNHWLRYKLPRRLLRKSKPECIGQKQKWFLVQLTAGDEAIVLDANAKPEFDQWQWVSYWYPLRYVVSFKRQVYRKALRELAPAFFHQRMPPTRHQPLDSIFHSAAPIILDN